MDYLLHIVVRNNFRRSGYIFVVRLVLCILIMCHFYVCFWIYLGDKYLMGDLNDPWLIANSEDFGEYSKIQTYIFAFYWIMETISTVGYGDYSGATSAEYCFSLLVEFSGMTLCAVLMFSVQRLFAEDFSFDTYIAHNYQRLDVWITMLEKSNHPRYIKPVLCQNIRQTLEVAFAYDFNVIIEEFNFYQ
jgi:hypothetical protein